MATHADEWVDSDEDEDLQLEDGQETSVELGIPNGLIEVDEDLADPAVSRIGGHPTFLSRPFPSIDASHCKICNQPGKLLVQLWCPLENSPYDRALYVWGCGKAGCQKKDGSVRAWRGLRYNEKYAKKLQKEQEREQRKGKQANNAPAVKTATPAFNPFSTSKPAPIGDLGSQIMGLNPNPFKTVATTSESKPQAESVEEPASNISDSEDEEDIVDALGNLTLEADSPWSLAPKYDPYYLDTETEYIPPAPKIPKNSNSAIKVEKGGEWSGEAYESSMNVDEVFERFVTRVGYRGEQCIRYELEGTPLFFQSDAVFKKLHTIPPGTQVPVTKAVFAAPSAQPKRTYTTSTVPPCPSCQSPRVFECQLMPSMHRALKDSSNSAQEPQTDAARRAALELALGKKTTSGSGVQPGQPNIELGMEWGTCLIFTCKKNCGRAGGPVRREEVGINGAFHEELVLIQWEE